MIANPPSPPDPNRSNEHEEIQNNFKSMNAKYDEINNKYAQLQTQYLEILRKQEEVQQKQIKRKFNSRYGEKRALMLRMLSRYLIGEPLPLLLKV
jgi:hypothetical protein